MENTALTTTKKTEITTSISKDIISQAMGIDSIDNISVRDCVNGYKRVEDFEKKAIMVITQRADHDRGMYIELIKLKEPDNWASIIEDELGVKRNRANQLAKYFRDFHSFEMLTETKLKGCDNTNSTLSENFKLEDLAFPDSSDELRRAVGLSKKEIAEIQKRLKKDGADKEEIEKIIAQMNLAKKAESYTKSKIDDIWKKLSENGLELRDDGKIYSIEDDNNEDEVETKVKTDTHLMDKIQEVFDTFSTEMQYKALELLNNPTKREKFYELGWTDEDEALYNESKLSKKHAGKIPDFFKEHYSSWNKVYRELSKCIHPDKGGSEEAQSFINDVNSYMSKLKVMGKYDKVILKHDEITTQYDKWRQAQTDDIKIDFIDALEEIRNKDER